MQMPGVGGRGGERCALGQTRDRYVSCHRLILIQASRSPGRFARGDSPVRETPVGSRRPQPTARTRRTVIETVGPQAEKERSAWSWVFASAPLLALAIALLAAVRAGLPAGDAGWALVAVTVTQTVPGVLIWRTVRPAVGSWFEDIVFGTAIGACLAVATQAAAGSLQTSWLAMAGGPLVALTLLAVPPTRSRIKAATTSPLPATWSVSVAAVSLLLIKPTQIFFRTVPLDWPLGFRSTYLDMPFHLSLASQIAERGPGQVPFVLGEPLQYHWFSHAWVAQVAEAAHVPLDGVLLRFMPALISVLAVCAVAAAAVRLGKLLWAGPLAALIAVAAGDLDIFRGSRPGSLVNHLSPSLGLSVVITLALLVLLVLRWRSETGRGSTILMLVLAVGAVGTKGSSLPVVVGGVALAAAVAWVFRWPMRRKITVDLALVSGSLVASVLILFRGGTGQVAVDVLGALSARNPSRAIMAAAEGTQLPIVLLAASVLMIGTLARGAGLLAGYIGPLRKDPALPLLLGTGLSGALAVLLLSHPGLSQLYFLRNAAPALAIGSGIGIVALWDGLADQRERLFWIAAVTGVSLIVVHELGFRDLPIAEIDPIEVAIVRTMALSGVLLLGYMAARRGGVSRLPAVAGVVGVAMVIVAVVPSVLGQVRTPLPDYNEQVASDARFAFSRDQIEAARWLRDHSDPDDVVATNRHCASPQLQRCDARRFYVAAYTERRVLVEGWAYTRSWAESPDVDPADAFKPFWDADLLLLNDSVVESASPAGAVALAEQGVRWLFIDKTAPYGDGLESIATPRFETEWSWVLELDVPPA